MDISILNSIFDWLKALEGSEAYMWVFLVLLACGLGVPIPEDITLITTGYLAYLENLNLYWGIVIGLVGVLAGDFFLFSMGRLYGDRITQAPGLKYFITPERLAKAREKLKHNSYWVCFTARFLAGLRAPIYLSAGILGVRPAIFVLMDGLAALISVPLIVYLGYHFGGEIEAGIHFVRSIEKYVVLALATVGLFFLGKHFLKKAQSRA